MKLLFVGETWNGSSALSMRKALSELQGVELHDIGEDHYRPKGRSVLIRGMNRLVQPLYRRELALELLRHCRTVKPDAAIVYKGTLVDAQTVASVRQLGIKAINVFPDFSPHAYGRVLWSALGRYDLVISTKPFHPEHWNTTYGYSNACVCVPHGYDPEVHYWPNPPMVQDIDVIMAATWRPQYEDLMVEVARCMPDSDIPVALAGRGWAERRKRFPKHWQYPGALVGRAYGEFVRRGRIAIAPVHTEVVIKGKRQPGDQDTTRTYELAAAGTFVLHRRTPFAMQVYREGEECEFWSDANELVDKIRYYLPREEVRRTMACAAHRRAVPAYSVPGRAQQVLAHIEGIVRDERIR